MIKPRNEKISISLDPYVLELLETEAEKDNRSRSNYIETILRSHLEDIYPKSKVNRKINLYR